MTWRNTNRAAFRHRLTTCQRGCFPIHSPTFVMHRLKGRLLVGRAVGDGDRGEKRALEPAGELVQTLQVQIGRSASRQLRVTVLGQTPTRPHQSPARCPGYPAMEPYQRTILRSANLDNYYTSCAFISRLLSCGPSFIPVVPPEPGTPPRRQVWPVLPGRPATDSVGLKNVT